MSLLSEQDIALAWIGVSDPIALGGNFKDSEHVKNFAANLEAAILAKLASAELPEPVVIDRHESGIVIRGYTAAHLQQAHAQGFAAGAAAQLSSEPVGFIDKCGEIFAQVEQILSTDTPLYTRREA